MRPFSLMKRTISTVEGPPEIAAQMSILERLGSCYGQTCACSSAIVHSFDPRIFEFKNPVQFFDIEALRNKELYMKQS